jgi:nickel-dependent lactate racemase
MTKIQIPYGSKLIEIDIEGELLDPIDKNVGKTKNRDVLRHALQNPIGTKKLKEIVNNKKDAKIVIVVDDHTRDAPTEKMLDCLIEEIGHTDRITLLVACGTHAPPGEEDLNSILGKHRFRFDIQIHNCDADNLVYVGTTNRGTPVILNRTYVDADIKILTGDVTLHYYAGFGGGRKSILPGISSRESIKRNHALLVDEQAKIANIENNPVHLDMCEAASYAPPNFVLNTVADALGNMIDGYAGEMNAVFLKGADAAKELYLRKTNVLFDVLLVSAGGFPKDRNLYQATKAIENCFRVIVPGGKLILVAESREGIGDPYFEDWMNKYTSYEAVEEAIKTNFVLGGHKAYYIRRVMKYLQLSLVSNLDTQTIKRWGINTYKSLLDAVKKEININDEIKVGIVKGGKDTLIVPTL